MRFERREHRPLALIILTPLLAVVAALALSGLLIAAAGAPVLEAYWRILVGAFGSRLSATETLTRATPQMLTGLAAAVAFDFVRGAFTQEQILDKASISKAESVIILADNSGENTLANADESWDNGVKVWSEQKSVNLKLQYVF